MKYLFYIFCFFSINFTNAQDIHLFVGGGTMNYQGDLQNKKITFNQAHPYASAGAYYELMQQIYIRAAATIGTVSAHDKFTPLNANRNLSFESKIMELQLGVEYDILNSYDLIVVPYIYGGLAAFHYSPFTYDKAGTKVFLQPLGTEGQGYGGRNKYGLTQLALPFGGGLKLSIGDYITIRSEIVFRKLFTDYLDDVSTVYTDPIELLAKNGAQTLDLAYRGDELNLGLNYPRTGYIRGNPKAKDFYYTVGLSISLRLSSDGFGLFGGGGGGGRAGGGGGGKASKRQRAQVGCPKNVY